MLNIEDYFKIIRLSFIVFIILSICGLNPAFAIILALIICTSIQLLIIRSKIKSYTKRTVLFKKMYKNIEPEKKDEN